MKVDARKVFGLIKKELASNRPLSESMGRIITLCAKSYPHEDWEQLQALEYDDLKSLRKWIATPFRVQPFRKKLAGLWFGLFNPVYSKKPVADIYVSGSTRFDPNPDDNSWAVGPDWWPEDRYAHSSILADIYKIAYRKNGLGNEAEYPLCLAFGTLAVRDLLRNNDPAIFLGSSPSVGVAVGFDSGDFILVGQLSLTELHLY
jgi:hypothetical protein